MAKGHLARLERLEESYRQAQEAMLKRQEELQAQITRMMELLLAREPVHQQLEINTDTLTGGFEGVPVKEQTANAQNP